MGKLKKKIRHSKKNYLTTHHAHKTHTHTYYCFLIETMLTYCAPPSLSQWHKEGKKNILLASTGMVMSS